MHDDSSRDENPMSQESKRSHSKDRKLAETGWGIKPDSQPANRDEVADPQDRFHYRSEDPGGVDEIVRVQQRNFNKARRIVVEPGRTRIIDINKHEFVVEGLSFGQEALIELLERFGAAFNAPLLRTLDADYTGTREFECTARRAWGADRSG